MGKGSRWKVTKDGRTRSELAREREARPEVKAARSANSKRLWENEDFRALMVAVSHARRGEKSYTRTVAHRLAKTTPLRGRTLSSIERAWLGAFIEADGSASLRGKGVSAHLTLSITQKIIEPIAVALRITQTGGVSRQNARPSSTATWVWAIYSRLDALWIALQCAPYSWKIQAALHGLKEEIGAELWSSWCRRLPAKGCDYEELRAKDKELRG